MKLAGPSGSRNFGAPMIDSSPGSAIACSSVFVLRLHVGCVEAALMKCALLFRTRMHINSARTTVVTDTTHGHIVHNRLVIDVNIGDVHVGHATVIEEGAVTPVSASVASTEISKTVVHATVKANVRAPISGMPDVITC